jgi:L-threonylcarbamoyladenylate synthase
MLEKHYSPFTPILMVSSESLDSVVKDYVKSGERVAVLAMRAAPAMHPTLTWINASDDPVSYGHSLYASLRALDKADAKIIVVEQVPNDEQWQAVRDRLQRAAAT